MTEAKRDSKAAAEPAAPTTGSTEVSTEPTPGAASEPAEPAGESDVRRKFREALERKNATPGTHPGSQADGANALKSSNGKRKREFRRKSGG